ncbi:hypothetical protein F4779DRAFT_619119 [Xylariaceae sp. FL0662B]|nr:hypothetical protein F4779DRAFT_619119 [Xylariaceae sp. FL0662B]
MRSPITVPRNDLHDIVYILSENRSEEEELAVRRYGGPLGNSVQPHIREPQIIHRDNRPANIRYQDQDDKSLPTDFGIARVVDASKTMIGTQWYATVDVHSLSATVAERLVGLKPVKARDGTQYASMLAYDAGFRLSGLRVEAVINPRHAH